MQLLLFKAVTLRGVSGVWHTSDETCQLAGTRGTEGVTWILLVKASAPCEVQCTWSTQVVCCHVTSHWMGPARADTALMWANTCGSRLCARVTVFAPDTPCHAMATITLHELGTRPAYPQPLLVAFFAFGRHDYCTSQSQPRTKTDPVEHPSA